jgi:hypothetical protein
LENVRKAESNIIRRESRAGSVPVENPAAMTASARTLSIEETLLEPPALPPPPTRHALLVF